MDEAWGKAHMMGRKIGGGGELFPSMLRMRGDAGYRLRQLSQFFFGATRLLGTGRQLLCIFAQSESPQR